ncbi:MAG TPA: hypothetical protein VG710_14515, partial [Opitutus sp.]|nr:hypothetical protein [Opitutus sp.]
MKPGPLRGMLHRVRARWVRWRSGTRIRCRGSGHRVDAADALLSGVTIEIEGTGNRLVIGAQTRMWGGSIKIHGRNLLCEVAGYCQLRNTELTVEDEGSRLILLGSVSGTGCRLLAGEGGLVHIGNDCMMSVDADVRNT